MAEIKIDITKAVKDTAERALDEYQYKGLTIRQWADENPTPCPISGGKCFYTYPPHPIPCEICQANLEQAKKREEAMKNETLLFMRAKR